MSALSRMSYEEELALKAEVTRLRARIEELAVEYREKNAHLWRERNALLAAAEDVLACDKALSDARAWNEGHIEERMVAELRMVQSFAPLRLAVDACSSAVRGDKQ